MTSTYFDPTAVAISNGTRADASDVNNVATAVDAGFAMLPEPNPLKQGRHLIATQGGTANAITFTTGLSLTSIANVGTSIEFKATTTNTSSVTATIDSIPTLAVTLSDGTALSGGEITLGRMYKLTSDGSKWILNSSDASASAAVATTQAGIATTQAGIATSQAAAAASSASDASASAAAAAAAVADVEQVIASGSIASGADLEFILSTLDATQSVYNRYRIDILGFLPATDNVDLNYTLSSDAGATDVTTGYYGSLDGRDSAGNGMVNSWSNAAAGKVLGQGSGSGRLSNVSGEESSVSVYVKNCNTGSSLVPHISSDGVLWNAVTPSRCAHQDGGGSNSAAADYDAIKFFFDSGNFTANGSYIVTKLAKP